MNIKKLIPTLLFLLPITEARNALESNYFHQDTLLHQVSISNNLNHAKSQGFEQAPLYSFIEQVEGDSGTSNTASEINTTFELPSPKHVNDTIAVLETGVQDGFQTFMDAFDKNGIAMLFEQIHNNENKNQVMEAGFGGDTRDRLVELANSDPKTLAIVCLVIGVLLFFLFNKSQNKAEDFAKSKARIIVILFFSIFAISIFWYLTKPSHKEFTDPAIDSIKDTPIAGKGAEHIEKTIEEGKEFGGKFRQLLIQDGISASGGGALAYTLFFFLAGLPLGWAVKSKVGGFKGRLGLLLVGGGVTVLGPTLIDQYLNNGPRANTHEVIVQKTTKEVERDIKDNLKGKGIGGAVKIENFGHTSEIKKLISLLTSTNSSNRSGNIVTTTNKGEVRNRTHGGYIKAPDGGFEGIILDITPSYVSKPYYIIPKKFSSSGESRLFSLRSYNEESKTYSEPIHATIHFHIFIKDGIPEVIYYAKRISGNSGEQNLNEGQLEAYGLNESVAKELLLTTLISVYNGQE